MNHSKNLRKKYKLKNSAQSPISSVLSAFHRRIRELQKELKLNRSSLKNSIYSKEIKNVLQNHKDLQRMFNDAEPFHLIDAMDHKTFTKRKQLDRLNYKKAKLTQSYEINLINLSELQDRMLYKDGCELTENLKLKKVQMDLQNTTSRMRAVRLINKSHKNIINIMMNDSMFFEPVLTALCQDVEKQQEFIETTRILAAQATQNLNQLTNQYKNLKKEFTDNTDVRIETFQKVDKLITENKTELKKIIRSDSDFEVINNRYDRDTESILNLKINLDENDKTIKLIQNATLCADIKCFFPRIRKQFTDNEKLLANIAQKEKEQSIAIEKEKNAKVMQEKIRHYLFPEDISRITQLKEISDQIAFEKIKQSRIQNQIQQQSDLISHLTLSFQHCLDVLKIITTPDVQERYIVEEIKYKNSDLNLPFLKYAPSTNAQLKTAPVPFEENANTLLDLIKNKIEILMRSYGQKTATR